MSEPTWSSFDTSHNSKRKQSYGLINDLSNVDWCPQTKILPIRRFFVVCVWRQRSSDQDDYKGKKSNNVTCFFNPQSCSWLIVQWNQFGFQNPNWIHWHHKPICRHIDQGTRHESQLPLRSWNEQHQRTGRLFLDAFSSSYSENGQELVSRVEIWWSDGSKNGETC